jgi:hypothetical protein
VDIERIEGLGAAPSKTHEHIERGLTQMEKEILRLKEGRPAEEASTVGTNSLGGVRTAASNSEDSDQGRGRGSKRSKNKEKKSKKEKKEKKEKKSKKEKHSRRSRSRSFSR